MEKNFQYFLNAFFTPSNTDISPTVEFAHLPFKRPMSQFEKSLSVLGTCVIHANSPQAKGRVERLFRPLQDQLVKEMRLNGITSVDDAKEFVKTFLPK